MARCIQQRDPQILICQFRLLGNDRDSALPLLHIMIQKAVPRIHTPCFTQHSGLVQKCLRQRRLARIHMRHNAQIDMSFFCFPVFHFIRRVSYFIVTSSYSLEPMPIFSACSRVSSQDTL